VQFRTALLPSTIGMSGQSPEWCWRSSYSTRGRQLDFSSWHHQLLRMIWIISVCDINASVNKPVLNNILWTKPSNLKIRRRFSVAYAIATPTELFPRTLFAKPGGHLPNLVTTHGVLQVWSRLPARPALLWKAYQTNRRAPPPDERILPAMKEL